MEWCRNSRRDLPNFESRTKSVAAARSTWSSSSRHASDLRIPVTASSPISVCQVAARSGGVNLGGGVDQRGDLARRIQVRRDPALVVRQRVLGRDLAVGVEGLVVAGEDPHAHQPPRQVAVVGAATAGRRRPLQRQVAGDPVAAAGLAVVDERHQLPALGGQLEPQGPPHRQIVLGGLPQPGHDHTAAVGHGRASGRSAFSSTLA